MMKLLQLRLLVLNLTRILPKVTTTLKVSETTGCIVSILHVYVKIIGSVNASILPNTMISRFNQDQIIGSIKVIMTSVAVKRVKVKLVIRDTLENTLISSTRINTSVILVETIDFSPGIVYMEIYLQNLLLVKFMV